jgi:hypothetical protein
MINQVKKIVVQAALALEVTYNLHVTETCVELATDSVTIQYEEENCGNTSMVVYVSGLQAAEFFTAEGDSEWDLDTIRYLVNQAVEHHTK